MLVDECNNVTYKNKRHTLQYSSWCVWCCSINDVYNIKLYSKLLLNIEYL